MPRNGSGGYNQPVSNFVAGTTIVSADVNSWFGDLGTEMANSIAKDGQTSPTANLPMGGFRHTGVADATARNHYLAFGQAQDGDPDWRGTAGGTANAITLSTSPVTTAYVTGEVHTFKTGASANTGAVTVNINSIGAQSLRSPAGALLVAGQLPASSLVTMRYDGTNFQMVALPTLVSVPVAQTGTVTLAAADLGPTQTFNISAVSNLNLPALSGVPSGTRTWVRNLQSSTAWVVIDGNSSETINGATTFFLFPGESVELVATAGGWLALGLPDYGWRRIAQTAASGAATVDFVLPSTMNAFVFEVTDLRPATDNTNLLIRTSTDGGSTFDAGASDYTYQLLSAFDVTTAATRASANAIVAVNAIDTATASHATLITGTMFPGDGTFLPQVLTNAVFQHNVNGFQTTSSGARRASATRVNAIRFLMSSGNISGRFTLLGRL